MKRSAPHPEILVFIRELERTMHENTLVLVEGKKDAASLAAIGLENVRQIKGPLFSFCESIAEELFRTGADTVALLTDLDAEGKKLYGKISRNLAQLGIKIDDSLRKKILLLHVAHIEGLATFLKNSGIDFSANHRTLAAFRTHSNIQK